MVLATDVPLNLLTHLLTGGYRRRGRLCHKQVKSLMRHHQCSTNTLVYTSILSEKSKVTSEKL
jgi:hypothetical protein